MKASDFFITSVGLEEKQKGGELALRKEKRCRRQTRGACGSTSGLGLALEDVEREPLPDVKDLLDSAAALRDKEDPLEELRRMIKKTKGKMDAQREVLGGFEADVQCMKRGGQPGGANAEKPKALEQGGAGASRPALSAPQGGSGLTRSASGSALRSLPARGGGAQPLALLHGAGAATLAAAPQPRRPPGPFSQSGSAASLPGRSSTALAFRSSCPSPGPPGPPSGAPGGVSKPAPLALAWRDGDHAKSGDLPQKLQSSFPSSGENKGAAGQGAAQRSEAMRGAAPRPRSSGGGVPSSGVLGRPSPGQLGRSASTSVLGASRGVGTDPPGNPVFRSIARQKVERQRQ